MGFLIELIQALFLVGLPVAVFTLAIVWWALQQGFFKETTDIKALGAEIKTMSKNKDQVGKNLLQKKWKTFGGGFYGVVAFFTWTVVEVLDVIEMISNFGGFIEFLRALNIGVVVNILVEALTNFITAMVWPFYWMKQIDTAYTWVWFVIAYAGYLAGLKMAQWSYLRRSGA